MWPSLYDFRFAGLAALMMPLVYIGIWFSSLGDMGYKVVGAALFVGTGWIAGMAMYDQAVIVIRLWRSRDTTRSQPPWI
jgi:hypothetical protein